MNIPMLGGVMGKTLRRPEKDVGHIDGFVVKYNTSTSVAITPRSIIVNDKYYTLETDTIHTLTTLDESFIFHYIYVDDDGSSPPIPAFYDSVTAPSWDAARQGWYNGNDRQIGVIESAIGLSIMTYFATQLIGKNVRNIYGESANLAGNMNPDGTWQVPNVTDTDSVTPVNAIGIQIRIFGRDVDSTSGVMGTNKEMGDINTDIFRGCFVYGSTDLTDVTTPFFPLGASRKIYIAGRADDDNALSAWLFGYELER